MATPQLSPGVLTREVDLTVGRAENVLDNIGAIAGPFEIGPVNEPITVSTEQELINNFGLPKTEDNQYEYWMSASSYLSYGGVLKVVRTDGDLLANANVGVGTSARLDVKIKNFDDYIIKTDDGKFEISGTPYKQIAITEYNPEESDREYEVKIPKSRLDERHYNKVREWAKNSIIESVIPQFKGEVHRVRVAIMEPGAWVSEHIDYNCDYSIRIHIPLVTNSDCALSVRRRGEEKEILHMQADGSAWFINQGFLHSAWNKGATVRKHMILSIYGQEDILGAL